jgi:hypothetical protein
MVGGSANTFFTYSVASLFPGIFQFSCPSRWFTVLFLPFVPLWEGSSLFSGSYSGGHMANGSTSFHLASSLRSLSEVQFFCGFQLCHCVSFCVTHSLCQSSWFCRWPSYCEITLPLSRSSDLIFQLPPSFLWALCSRYITFQSVDF